MQFVRDNIICIDSLESITHEINRKKLNYITSFKGTNDKIVLYGNLSSGFQGSGSETLYNILVELGVEQDIAKDEIHNIGENNYQFGIKV